MPSPSPALKYTSDKRRSVDAMITLYTSAWIAPRYRLSSFSTFTYHLQADSVLVAYFQTGHDAFFPVLTYSRKKTIFLSH
jgi:hypothetical protein